MQAAFYITLFTIFWHKSMGNRIDYYSDFEADVFASNTTMELSTWTEYNDTWLDELLDSSYLNIRSWQNGRYGSIHQNWRYQFSEDMDLNKDGFLSDEEKLEKLKNGMKLIFTILDKDNDENITPQEASSVSLNLDQVTDLFNFYFDIFPERYRWTLYDLMRMRYADIDKDASLTLQETERYWRVKTNEQKRVVKELFTFIDVNKDNRLSMDDLKTLFRLMLPMFFKIFDQNNDGMITLDDLNFNVQWDDVTNILDFIKQTYLPDGEFNLNRLLTPFGYDLNGDGVMNNFDLYVLLFNNVRYTKFGSILGVKVLKTLDQDQDGVYKFDDIKNFVVSFWSILDANSDMNLSLDDGLLLFKNRLGVDEDNISALKRYLNYTKKFIKDETIRLIEFAFKNVDRNEDEQITIEELYQMPALCFYQWRGDECFDFNRFPDAPWPLTSLDIFPKTDYPRTSRVETRVLALIFSALDSPKFSNVKAFDWQGASKIENEIESLVPKGEELLDELRHKVSAYKQMQAYLNSNAEE